MFNYSLFKGRKTLTYLVQLKCTFVFFIYLYDLILFKLKNYI
jgi:hypothetical protein